MRGGLRSSTTIGHLRDFDPTSKAHVAPPPPPSSAPSSFIIFHKHKKKCLNKNLKRRHRHKTIRGVHLGFPSVFHLIGMLRDVLQEEHVFDCTFKERIYATLLNKIKNTIS